MTANGKSHVIVRTVDVQKVYRMGKEKGHALRGINLDIYRPLAGRELQTRVAEK